METVQLSFTKDQAALLKPLFEKMLMEHENKLLWSLQSDLPPSLPLTQSIIAAKPNPLARIVILIKVWRIVIMTHQTLQ